MSHEKKTRYNSVMSLLFIFKHLSRTSLGRAYGLIISNYAAIAIRAYSTPQIFIATVSLLAAFNIEKALDSDGKPIPPKEDHKSAIIRFVLVTDGSGGHRDLTEY